MRRGSRSSPTRVAKQFHLAQQDRASLKLAALAHDLGEVAMERDYIKRTGPLTEDERLDLARHPVIGEQEAARAGADRGAQLLVRWHQEWWNGAGYPDALRARADSSGRAHPARRGRLRGADGRPPFSAGAHGKEAREHLANGPGSNSTRGWCAPFSRSRRFPNLTLTPRTVLKSEVWSPEEKACVSRLQLLTSDSDSKLSYEKHGNSERVARLRIGRVTAAQVQVRLSWPSRASLSWAFTSSAGACAWPTNDLAQWAATKAAALSRTTRSDYRRRCGARPRRRLCAAPQARQPVAAQVVQRNGRLVVRQRAPQRGEAGIAHAARARAQLRHGGGDYALSFDEETREFRQPLSRSFAASGIAARARQQLAAQHERQPRGARLRCRRAPRSSSWTSPMELLYRPPFVSLLARPE